MYPLLVQDISQTQRDSIFAQAALNKSTWDLAVQVMDLFEQAKLKSQKLCLASLTQKPEFKQNYLTPIRGLSVTDQCSLLQQIIDFDLSLEEMQKEANKIKQRSALQAIFVKLTNCQSWENAQEQFPHFATEGQLDRFLHANLKKAIPKALSGFCHWAKTSCALQNLSGSSITVRGRIGSLLVSAITEVNGNAIRKVHPPFTGANLVVTRFEDNDNTDNIAYTIKEINSSCGLRQYTAACLTTAKYSQVIHEVWQRAFGRAELLFIANTSINKGMFLLLLVFTSLIL